ncbi:hypothetical protein OG963_00970 [Streptomyces sp. NBC_01707]|uniref:hypothetical protein n=1 Tax=Streptomyces sp. NBC_01707 TaxID=2975914 RepID=UPI00352FE462
MDAGEGGQAVLCGGGAAAGCARHTVGLCKGTGLSTAVWPQHRHGLIPGLGLSRHGFTPV